MLPNQKNSTKLHIDFGKSKKKKKTIHQIHSNTRTNVNIHKKSTALHTYYSVQVIHMYTQQKKTLHTESCGTKHEKKKKYQTGKKGRRKRKE